MFGDSLALAGITPDSLGRQIHVGAVGRIGLIMNGAVVEMRLGAADPAAVGEQAEPEIGSRNVAIAALGETFLPRHQRLDEGEIAAVRQMRTISHD